MTTNGVGCLVVRADPAARVWRATVEYGPKKVEFGTLNMNAAAADPAAFRQWLEAIDAVCSGVLRRFGIDPGPAHWHSEADLN